MGTYGRTVLSSKVGHPIQLTANGEPIWHPIGITIDWSAVVAVTGSPVTLPDGTTIPVGQKYLRWGQVMVKAGTTYRPFLAADGAALKRSETVLLNQLILENGSVPGLTAPASAHAGVIEGGLVWKDRIIANATADGDATGPTYAHLEAALPELRYVD